MAKELTQEEIRVVQLSILKEFHEYCKQNHIRYSLSCGTLLGAIRHKGFIPWDDDIDIMMPITDINKIKKDIKSDIFFYVDSECYAGFPFSFSRLVSSKTYHKIGLSPKGLGVSIDVYPVINIPCNYEEQESFFGPAERDEKILSYYWKWGGRLSRYLGISKIPGYEACCRIQYKHLIEDSIKFSDSGCFYVDSGPLKNRRMRIFNQDLFHDIIEVDFEKYKFFAIKSFDNYLTQTYGDYMKLPPEQDRIPNHPGHFFSY